MKFISIEKDDDSKFDELVKKRPSFVKFYHPMCGHCQSMKPAWNDLQHNKQVHNQDINIIEVHTDAIPNIKSNIAQKAGNQGIPFIIEAKIGGEAGQEYNGDRSEDSMVEFILNKISDKTQSGGKKTKKTKKTKRVKKTKKTKRVKKTKKTKRAKKAK